MYRTSWIGSTTTTRSLVLSETQRTRCQKDNHRTLRSMQRQDIASHNEQGEWFFTYRAQLAVTNFMRKSCAIQDESNTQCFGQLERPESSDEGKRASFFSMYVRSYIDRTSTPCFAHSLILAKYCPSCSFDRHDNESSNLRESPQGRTEIQFVSSLPCCFKLD